MVQTQKSQGIGIKNSQLLTVQILTNDVQVLILCLSYFVTTVPLKNIKRNLTICHCLPCLLVPPPGLGSVVWVHWS